MSPKDPNDPKNPAESSAPPDQRKDDREEQRRGRRRLLTGGGLVMGGVMVPDKWVTPVVESVVLPAHAQTSPLPLIGRLVLALPGAGVPPTPTPDSSPMDYLLSPAYAEEHAPSPAPSPAPTSAPSPVPSPTPDLCDGGDRCSFGSQPSGGTMVLSIPPFGSATLPVDENGNVSGSFPGGFTVSGAFNVALTILTLLLQSAECTLSGTLVLNGTCN